MPRRTRPRRRRAAAEDEPTPLSLEAIALAPAGWHARRIQPARAVKEYVCPGCNQAIRPGTGHVVAWREGAEADRRHWHAGCWDIERRRRR